jgi:hypothetical protein
LLTPSLVAPRAADEKSPERRFSPFKLSGLTIQAYSIACISSRYYVRIYASY